MLQLQDKVVRVLQKDPAVASIASSIGSGNGNASVSQGRIFLSLKPLPERPGSTANDVINRLRRPLGAIRENPQTRAFLLDLMKETVAVGRALGVDLPADYAQQRLAFADTLPGWGALVLIMVAAMAVTPFLNNAATVLVMAPIASSFARVRFFGPTVDRVRWMRSIAAAFCSSVGG